MARRRQTTGLPKKTRKENDIGQPEDSSILDRLLGYPSTRTEREDAINTLLQRTTIGIIALIGLIIGVALVYQFMLTPTFSVATINGEKITVSEFRSRVELERMLVLQQAQVRYSQLQQQAAAFGMEVDQLLQQDQQFQEWNRELQLTDILGQRVLDDMILDVLIAQEAEARNITINEDAVQDQINTYFGYDPTQVAMIGADPTETPIPTITPTPFVSPTPTTIPSPTPVPTEAPEATEDGNAESTEEPAAMATIPPSPTPSQEDVRENFDEAVELFRSSIMDEAQVSNEDIDAFFEREALRNALMDAVVEVDTQAPFVNARHILVETEEAAMEIIAALDAGESFGPLAQAHSIDTGSGSRGGELGWAAAGNYVPEFRDATLQASIGEIVGPVESQFGFHIIQVRAREDREISGTERDRLRFGEFQTWLENYREENDANISINEDWPSYLQTN